MGKSLVNLFALLFALVSTVVRLIGHVLLGLAGYLLYRLAMSWLKQMRSEWRHGHDASLGEIGSAI